MAGEEVRTRVLRLRSGGGRSSRLIDDAGARLEIALAVVARGRSILVARRADAAHLGGSWEFPGGKIEDGEDPGTAAVRELREETRLEARDIEPLLVFVHDYPDRRLRFHVFLVREAVGDVATDGGRPWAWEDAAALDALPMPEANRAILRALKWRLG